MTARAFSAEQDKEVERLYKQGHSSIEIAKMFGVDKSSVLGALARRGVERRTNRSLTDVEEAEIAKSYLTGKPAMKIAEDYGVSVGLIFGALERQGVDSRGNFDVVGELAKRVASMYDSGTSIAQICRETGYGRKSITSAIEREGVEIGKPKTKAPAWRKLSKEQDKQIASMYIAGSTREELARFFGVDMATTDKAMKREGVGARKRVYSLDEYAFDKLDNEQALYWLGFAYADGSVYKNNFRVGLHEKDEDQLEKLNLFLQTEKPIAHWQSTNCVTVNMEASSQHIADRLRALGITKGRGQFHLLEPKIDPNLARHFIRGLIDGDGCISTNFQVVLLGQEDLLIWVRRIVALRANVSGEVKIRQRKGICEVSWGGRNQVERILDYLYNDATVYMPRKKAIGERLVGRRL